MPRLADNAGSFPERQAIGEWRSPLISVFEYVDGVFQLNVWGIALAFLFLMALGSRAARK